MRRITLACLGYASLTLAPLVLGQLGCSTTPQSQHVIRASEPIQGGTVDQTDTNVVGILIGSNGQLNSLCSGSLIGPNLILTAHHCVATPPNNLVCGGKFSTSITAATDFAVTTSYDAAEQIWVSSNPAMPTPDGVTWWGVSKVDVPTTNNVCAADQALLTLSSSISGVCPLIPAVDVQPTTGAAYTAIGFGITTPNGQTAGTRYELTSGLSVQCIGSAGCNDNTIGATGEWEGGSSAQEGTCEGDSGGPALDSSHRIIGTVSRGPSGACNQTVYESTYDDSSTPTTNGAWIKQIAQEAATAGGYTAAGWVTGGATSNPANGYPCSSSSSSSSSGSSSSSSSGSSSSGSSGSGSSSSGGSSTCPSGTTCQDGDGMGDYGCFAGSGTNISIPTGSPKCSASTACATGYTCWATNASGTKGECVLDCTTGTTSSSSGSGSSGTSGSGSSGTSGSGSSGTSGSGSSGTSGSGSSGGTGGSAAAGGTGSSGGTGGEEASGTGSGSGSGSSGAGGGTSSGIGIGGGPGSGTSGTGAGRGTGANGGYPSSPGANSGCAVAPTGSNEPAAPTSLAGLLLGAALMIARRRR